MTGMMLSGEYCRGWLGVVHVVTGCGGEGRLREELEESWRR